VRSFAAIIIVGLVLWAMAICTVILLVEHLT
jgi:hypothetical protein